MKKHFLTYLLSFFIVTIVIADEVSNTVRFNLPDDYDRNSGSATIVSPGSFELYAEEGTDGGSSFSAPAKIYIPVDEQDGGGVNEARQAIYAGIPTELSGSYTGTISVKLEAEVIDSTKRRVCVLTKIGTESSGDWQRIPFDDNSCGSYMDQSGSYEVTCQFEFSSISGLTAENLTENSTKSNVYAYFFLATLNSSGADTCEEDVSSPVSDITADSVKGGAFVQFYLSSAVPDADDDTVEIDSTISPRDEQAVVHIASADNISNSYKTIAYSIGSEIGAGSFPDSYRNSIHKFYPFITSGDLTVDDLTNNTTYYFAIASVNKFLFATKLTASHGVEPKPFEELLDQQQCYLLTAGFQNPHYVLDYFRSLRDNVLLKNKFGKIFVFWYYSTAPKYAHIIKNSSILSALIRLAGYVGYFLIKYFMMVLFVTIMLTFIALWFKILRRGHARGIS